MFKVTILNTTIHYLKHKNTLYCTILETCYNKYSTKTKTKNLTEPQTTHFYYQGAKVLQVSLTPVEFSWQAAHVS